MKVGDVVIRFVSTVPDIEGRANFVIDYSYRQEIIEIEGSKIKLDDGFWYNKELYTVITPVGIAQWRMKNEK